MNEQRLLNKVPHSTEIVSPLIDFPTRTIALDSEDLEKRRSLAHIVPENSVPFSKVMEKPLFIRPHLLLTNRCNMTCSYCFADEGTYGRDIAGMEDILSEQIALFAANSLLDDIPVALVHFGGEPLLNLQTMQTIVNETKGLAGKYGSSHFYNAVITNGTMITEEVASFLVDNEIKVVLSLDGRKSLHDRVRKLKNDEGSFERIIAGLSYFPTGYPLIIRATISYWTDIPKEIVFFRSLGASEIEFGYLGEYPSEVNIIESLKHQLNQLFVHAIKNDDSKSISKVRPFNDWMKKIHAFTYHKDECYSSKDCGAGRTRLAITPDGSILPCIAFYNLDDWKDRIIGHVSHGIDRALQVDFLNKSFTERQQCFSCFHRIVCAGPCLGPPATAHGNFLPDCYSPHSNEDTVTGMTQSLILYWYCILREEKPVLLNQILEEI
ncbi:radical SAM protein [Chloroflexota bacterium]